MRSDDAVIVQWLDGGERVVSATLVVAEGSTSHDVGAVFYVSESGKVAGAVSGGCVESALFHEAEIVFRTGAAHLVSYGPDDESPFGLTCGGTIEVLLALVDPQLHAAVRAGIAGNEPVVVAARLGTPGEWLVVTADRVSGAFTNEDVGHAAVGEARTLLNGGESGVRSFGPNGEPIGEEERCFFHVFAEEPAMYVVGAIDFTRPLASVAKLLGYRVVVIDARDVFATAARVPDADEIVVGWPDDVLAERRLDARSAVVVLTHDAKFDIPVLRRVIRTDAGYIGVMGSRETHRKRVEALREAGLDDRDLERINAPIGLDIGARTPEETAVAIAAEIVAQRNARGGGRLRDAAGNLRGRPLTPAS